MTKLKRNIAILVLSIIIYLLILYLKSCIITESKIEVYVLNKDINRGEEILDTDFNKMVVNSKDLNFEFVDNVENLSAKIDLTKGKILCKEDVIKKEEYQALEDEKKERIIIELDDIDSKVQKDIAKSSVINIYYTGRSSQVDNLVSSKNFKKLKSSSIADGYTTVALLNSIKVVEVYNKNGEVISESSLNQATYAIAIEVEEEMAMLIQNLKKYGKFNVTTKK